MISAILLLVLVAQSAAVQTPIKLGEAARQLAATDVEHISRASVAMGSEPWLIAAEPGWMNSRSRGTNVVEAYLAPQTSTTELRRGIGVMLARGQAQAGPPAADGGWTMQGTFNWAQIKIADREFSDIQADRDTNRPFTVTGRFRDSEILGIVRFVRTGPAVPRAGTIPGDRVPADWPVMTINRSTETLRVLLRAEKREALVLELRSENNVWSVVSASLVSID